MNRIRELREENGWTMADLGKRLECTESAISNYELGKRVVSYELWLKLAEIFDTTVDYIAGNTPSKPPSAPISKKDRTLIEWFRGLPLEKQKAIALLANAPTEIF